MLSNPFIITIVSMVVGLAALIGLDFLIKKLDARLQQRQAPVSFRRWLPVAKRLNDTVIEIVEFSSARWDQVPMLLLGGFMVGAILISLYPWPSALAQGLGIGAVVAIVTATLLASLWLRSRHTYYRLDLISGQVRRQTRTFGRGGKISNYLLKLPVQASSDCQYKDPDRAESFLRYATCWPLDNGGKLRIVHRSQEEAEQFRSDLAHQGCPILEPVAVNNE